LSVVAIAAIAAGAYYLLIDLYGAGASEVGTEDREATPVYNVAAELTPAPDEIDGISRPERITIPAIGVDGPVLEMRIGSDGLWDADSIVGEVGHLQGTPWPGEGGNSVLAAHVTVPEGAYGPFKDLDTLSPGQRISIWMRDGTLYEYAVDERKVVLATAIEVIAPTEEPTLTLITCTGWDENQETYLERIVVTARLVEVLPPL
jgi:sortase A